MSVFSDDLRALIVAAGLGTYGTDLFISSSAQIPTGAGPYTHIRDTGGSGSQFTQDKTDGTAGDGTAAYVFPSAQVMVKASEFDTAMTKAVALFAVITKVNNELVNGTWYRRIRMLQPQPFDLGQLDDSDRAQVVFNVLADKRP